MGLKALASREGGEGKGHPCLVPLSSVKQTDTASLISTGVFVFDYRVLMAPRKLEPKSILVSIQYKNKNSTVSKTFSMSKYQR